MGQAANRQPPPWDGDARKIVMDTTATSLSMDNHIPILVFALSDPENIYRVVMGENIGTIVKEEEVR